jgi:hypothetical protein
MPVCRHWAAGRPGSLTFARAGILLVGIALLLTWLPVNLAVSAPTSCRAQRLIKSWIFALGFLPLGTPVSSAVSAPPTVPVSVSESVSSPSPSAAARTARTTDTADKVDTTVNPLENRAAIIRDLHCGGLQVGIGSEIGRGGTGGVFKALLVQPKSSLPTAVKISYPSTALALRKECRTYQHLASRNAENVQRCLAMCDDGDRTVIVLQPLVEVKTSSSDDGPLTEPVATITDPGSFGQVATRNLLHGVVGIINGGFASSDLQFLVNPLTGDVTIIDLSEAQPIDNGGDSFQQLALVSSFIHEALAAIPPNLQEFAVRCIADEMENIRQLGSMRMSERVQQLLLSL